MGAAPRVTARCARPDTAPRTPPASRAAPAAKSRRGARRRGWCPGAGQRFACFARPLPPRPLKTRFHVQCAAQFASFLPSLSLCWPFGARARAWAPLPGAPPLVLFARPVLFLLAGRCCWRRPVLSCFVLRFPPPYSNPTSRGARPLPSAPSPQHARLCLVAAQMRAGGARPADGEGAREEKGAAGEFLSYPFQSQQYNMPPSQPASSPRLLPRASRGAGRGGRAWSRRWP